MLPKCLFFPSSKRVFMILNSLYNTIVRSKCFTASLNMFLHPQTTSNIGYIKLHNLHFQSSYLAENQKNSMEKNRKNSWVPQHPCNPFKIPLVCNVKCAVCSVQCAVCSVQCAVFSVQCIVCSVQLVVYSMQCVMPSYQPVAVTVLKETVRPLLLVEVPEH